LISEERTEDLGGEKLTETDDTEDPGTDRRMILKWTFKKRHGLNAHGSG
jgi:hypothetical protein